MERTTTDHDVTNPSLLPQAADRKGRAPSSWVLKDPKDRTFWERICAIDICPPEVYFERERTFERGPVPVHPIWRENLFILSVGLAPIYVQFASYTFLPQLTWNPWAAWFFYSASFIWFVSANIARLHRYMLLYGVFDEKVRGRDLISDIKKDKLASGILIFIILRTAAPFLLAFDRTVKPSFSVFSPLKVATWLVALDFFFYIYHRSCHEVPWLWHVHRAHHGTKHPTPILSLLADDYQEVIEVILVPLCASAVVNLTFFEGWVGICYLIYVEMLGHSGIRAHWAHPILSPLLKHFDMDLAVEDHELHHRYGRGGKNYGKQSRIFDKLLGTIVEREDTKGL